VDKQPADNITITLMGENIFTVSTLTNETGYYRISIPYGEFSIIVSDDTIIYDKYDFSVGTDDPPRFKDFELDPQRRLYRLYGEIYDEELERAAYNFKVNATGIDDEEYDKTNSDFYGYYELIVPEGEYTICVSKNNEEYCKEKVLVSGSDTQLNLTIKEIPEEEEDIFAWINFNQITSDLIDNWWALIFILILLVITPILFTFVDKIDEKLDHRKYRFIDEKTVIFLEKIARYILIITFIILLIMFFAWLFPGFDNMAWKHIAPHIPAVYTIILLFIIMRLLMLISKTGMDYLRGDLSWKPKLKISPRYIGMLDIVLKYIIVLIFGINILILALAIFGMGNLIYDSVTGFFSENSGYILFIIVILVLIYFISRFLGTFIADMKRKEAARISPQVADVVGKVGKIVIYIFGAMIIIFALLQMAKMGDLGQTLILMISMIIGFVVAMAATGSIGNVLSGLVLNAFRPYEVGDRVKIGETIGDVVGSNLAFVQLETLNSEIIEIPNNTVIADKIINYSKSGSFAITVDSGIGYDVPNNVVRKLLLEAARETKDIEDEPRPHMLILELGDYSITYRLKAYTTNAKAMVRIKSNLMANIQEMFYSHGVEILSPEYLVRRQETAPTEKKLKDIWSDIDKKGEEVFEKETEEKIGKGFDLMDKTLGEDN
jgi:small-conductance mechanosensitive channel